MRFLGDVQAVLRFRRQRTRERRDDSHGMGIAGEVAHHAAYPFRQAALATNRRLESTLLRRRRQPAVQQQVANLKEIGLFGQIFNGVAAMQQRAGVAVDIGDVGVAGGGGNEARVVGEIAVLGQCANVDDLVAEAGFKHRQMDRLVVSINE